MAGAQWRILPRLGDPFISQSNGFSLNIRNICRVYQRGELGVVVLQEGWPVSQEHPIQGDTQLVVGRACIQAA